MVRALCNGAMVCGTCGGGGGGKGQKRKKALCREHTGTTALTLENSFWKDERTFQFDCGKHPGTTALTLDTRKQFVDKDERTFQLTVG